MALQEDRNKQRATRKRLAAKDEGNLTREKEGVQLVGIRVRVINVATVKSVGGDYHFARNCRSSGNVGTKSSPEHESPQKVLTESETCRW